MLAPHVVTNAHPRPLSEPLVDAQTLAAHFQVDVRLVRRWARENRIPRYRLQNGARKILRFRISEVESALRVAPQ